MRVKIPATGLYTYPDVVVTCGKEEYEDEVFDILLNPSLGRGSTPDPYAG